MTVTQYVGARYVPLFADPIEWSRETAYEPLTIVIHEGNSYTSRQAVPKGIDIANDEFWALTSNYNAQVESYRKETAKAVEDAGNALSLAQTNEQDIATLDSEMAGTSDSGLKEIASKSKQVSMPLVMPTRNGSIRVATHQWDDTVETKNYIQWPQGLCLDNDGKIYCALIDSSKQTVKASIYTRENDPSNAFSLLNTQEFYHAASMTYVPELNKLLVTKGSDGMFMVVDPTSGLKEKEITNGIFSSSLMVSYDKKTNKLYASSYGTDLYEMSTDGNYTPTKIDAFDNGMIDSKFISNSVLQDMAVYDDYIYLLFSSPMMIVKLNMNNQIVASCHLMPNDTYAYVGETEGIDVYDGKIYISSLANWTYNTHVMTRIWTIPLGLDNLAIQDYQASTNTQRHVVSVDAQEGNNLLTHQTPDGSAGNAFVCVNEAIEYAALNPQVRTIFVNGRHREEAVYLSTSMNIIGKTGQTTDNIGYIYTSAPSLKLAKIRIAPLKKNLPYFVNSSSDWSNIGYVSTGDNRIDVYIGDSGAPTSGYTIGTHGTIYTMDTVSKAVPKS